jgi:diaminopimelate decarboxylase
MDFVDQCLQTRAPIGVLMRKKIYISGMHSGQNPCAGIGIARSLKKAFPQIAIVGVDHWQGSSGLHDSVVDEVVLLPQWKQINDERHAKYVRSLLDAGHLWISGLDMEVRWLAENVGPHENLLAPGPNALKLTEKPAVSALEGLGLRVPDFIPAELSDSEIHTFLRHSSWQCWLKSPYHDAKRVSSWISFERARDAMSRSWETSRLFLQRNVLGKEESICFTAYQGELLAAVKLEKRLITPEGKTWAARVTPASPEIFEHFKKAVRLMNWSGGGELEYVRDPDDQKWIIECNPRFPAWIFGGALAGVNLPARLVARVLGLSFVEEVPKFPCFTRVVQEIPANEDIGLPLPQESTAAGWGSDGKKGKGGMPSSVASLPKLKESSPSPSSLGDEEDSESPQNPETLPEGFASEIERFSKAFQGETPARVLLEDWTGHRFKTLADHIETCRYGRPEIRIGYSVKTSPTEEHLKKAKKHGFFAECISQREVRRAMAHGFAPKEIILNGPGKFWPITEPPVPGLHMMFCDSVEEFDRIIDIPKFAGVIGFRMKLPHLHSRFGNSLDEFKSFQRIAERVKKLRGKAELGFHFHMPSWAIGMERWMQSLDSLLLWCRTFQQVASIPVRHLDLGGGFFPADLEHLDFAGIQQAVHVALPEARAIYFEPGRALTQDGEALVSRVLDVRKDSDGDLSEIVVDACIAELPLAQAYNHRVFYRSMKKVDKSADGKSCQLLQKGTTRILGRICMEDDILSAGVDLPEEIDVGDLVIFGDAGAYERTMSYDFGRG